MTDLITAEEAGKLLDGTTPGPWEACGEVWNRKIYADGENRVCFMAHSNGLDDDRDIATSNLVAAAPDLARTALALHQQLADAKIAQALVVDRAAEVARRHHSKVQINEPLWHDGQDWAADRIAEALEALADPSGVEALAALRAERDALKVRYDDLYADALADAKSDAQDFEGELWKAIRSILDDFDYDWSGDALEDGVTANEAAEFIRDVLDGETMRADTAIAERDALAAAGGDA